MNYGINNLWPTTVLYDQIADKPLLDNFLQEIFLTFDLDNLPDEHYDVIREGGIAAQEFKDNIIVPAFEQYLNTICKSSLSNFEWYEFKTWIPVTGHRYLMSPHNHSRSSLSGVFYLLCEDRNKGGDLELLDPRPNVNRGYDTEFASLFPRETISPASGDMIIFPSFVFHNTNEFMGQRRIALGVDLYTTHHRIDSGLGL